MWRFFFKVHLVFFKLMFNPSKAKNVECVNAIDGRRTFLHDFMMSSIDLYNTDVGRRFMK